MSSSRTLKEKLNYLRAATAPAGRGSYSAAEIAAGTGLSETYVKYLLSGSRENPSMDVLERIGRFFGVKDIRYFFDDVDTDVVARVESQLESLGVLAALRSNNVTAVAARLGEMSVDDLRLLRDATSEALKKSRTSRTVPPDAKREGGQ